MHEYVITLHKTDGCIDSSMPYLRQRFGYTVVEFEAWISKYILHNIVVVLINPCLTFKFANECQNSVEDKVQGWLGLRPANERRRYNVTPSLIGCEQT